MGYQGYGQWGQPGVVPEDRILEDLEYLKQMYPTYARKYQGVISSVVDNTAPVTGTMAENPMLPVMEADVMGSNVTDKTLTENAPWNEKEPWIRELVTVLMYYEILTRRRKKNRQWYNGIGGNGHYQI